MTQKQTSLRELAIWINVSIDNIKSARPLLSSFADEQRSYLSGSLNEALAALSQIQGYLGVHLSRSGVPPEMEPSSNTHPGTSSTHHAAAPGSPDNIDPRHSSYGPQRIIWVPPGQCLVEGDYVKIELLNVHGRVLARLVTSGDDQYLVRYFIGQVAFRLYFYRSELLAHRLERSNKPSQNL